MVIVCLLTRRGVWLLLCSVCFHFRPCGHSIDTIYMWLPELAGESYPAYIGGEGGGGGGGFFAVGNLLVLTVDTGCGAFGAFKIWMRFDGFVLPKFTAGDNITDHLFQAVFVGF